MTKLLLAAFSALALLAAGCAHNRDDNQSRSAGTVVDDAGLTAKVKTAIARDAGAGTAANINVNSYRGQVQLSGFVDTQERADQAVSIARGVSGVQGVQNSLQVKSAASGSSRK